MADNSAKIIGVLAPTSEDNKISTDPKMEGSSRTQVFWELEVFTKIKAATITTKGEMPLQDPLV